MLHEPAFQNKLYAAFQEINRPTPLDYVNRVRLERSKQLLQITDDRLHDIASHVGFNNEYYFSRRFKQYAGVSPGVYRRHHRQEVSVFAPYLEDFLLALGVKPILQGSHRAWGKQRYLQLDDVPEFDVSQLDAEFQAGTHPSLLCWTWDIKHGIWIDSNRWRPFIMCIRRVKIGVLF